MRSSPTRLAALCALALVAVTFLVFARGLRGGFVYDDYYLIETNPALRAPGPLGQFLATGLFEGTHPADVDRWSDTGRLYWRPFVKLAYLLQFRGFGTRPLGYHVVSLIVHAACVLLAFRWLLGRVRRRAAPAGGTLGVASSDASRGTVIAAALGALLFALHPSRAEAVAWVSGSTDLWMGFWVLLGLWAWEGRGAGRALAAALCFALAVLCKEAAVLVPLVLAADAALLGDPPGGRRRALAPLAGVATMVVLRAALLPLPKVGLGGGVLAAIERGLASLGLYVVRVLWPVHPSTQIGLVGPDGRFELPARGVALGAAFALGFVALAFAARRARAARRGSPAREALADLAWFLVPLLPVLQVVPLGYTTLVAERFLYVPFLGFASLVTRGLRSLRMPAHAVGLAAAVGCAAIVVGYLPSFRSNETLWAHELGLQPRNPLLHVYAARAAWQAARLDAALDAARAAYQHAVHPEVRTQAAVLWAEVRLQLAQGRERELLDELRSFFDAVASGGKATLAADGTRFDVEAAVEPVFDPRTAMAFRSARAVAHARSGSYQTAEMLLRALLPEDSSPATATGLARVLACQERWEEALAVLAAAARLHPRDAGLGTLAFTIRRCRDLAASPPEDVLDHAVARAELWVQLGVPALARRDLAPHFRGHEGDPRVLIPLAFADAADGDTDSARRALQAARDRTPDLRARAVWDAALEELRRWSASPAAEARPDTDALFR